MQASHIPCLLTLFTAHFVTWGGIDQRPKGRPSGLAFPTACESCMYMQPSLDKSPFRRRCCTCSSPRRVRRPPLPTCRRPPLAPARRQSFLLDAARSVRGISAIPSAGPLPRRRHNSRLQTASCSVIAACSGCLGVRRKQAVGPHSASPCETRYASVLARQSHPPVTGRCPSCST